MLYTMSWTFNMVNRDVEKKGGGADFDFLDKDISVLFSFTTLESGKTGSSWLWNKRLMKTEDGPKLQSRHVDPIYRTMFRCKTK